MNTILFALGLLLAATSYGYAAGEAVNQSAHETKLWQALASERHVVLMRHATAPGTGDPSNFALRDCATQRNLSDEGRAQAARIGARFRAAGIASARVLSSQWCRCLETAKLLGLGPVEELASLNSFFSHPDRRAAATQALKDWLIAQPLEGPIVLVTHQVNITALTGIYPRSGEMVILQRIGDGGLLAAGRIETE
ncbi:histidine phosphatase family protein [Pelagibius sp. Alg239-R121]|uniref:histidine phosphatase family protein n=1 Tax=Pelagibius sp. Alg239-R121 TaxID=2993448 RepID=UPI0024A68C31|nr:histidine phosphatase family protein [Pelagibius sp. Alg239-R121]